MIDRNVKSFLEGFSLDGLIERVEPQLLRSEDAIDQRRGLDQVVRHTLLESARLSCWHRDGNGLEHNVTELKDRSGARLVVTSKFQKGHWRDRDVFEGLQADRDCDACAELPPPWGYPTDFCADLPVVPSNRVHIAIERTYRFGPYSSAQVLARVPQALRESVISIKAGRVASAAYWYPGQQRMCHVVPLALKLGGPVDVAGVLNRVGDEYKLATVLDLHSAFWNVASLGVVPPPWLDSVSTTGVAA